MDPSGIGNIAYGYTTGFYDIPIALAEGFAALKQGQNAVTMAEIEAQCGDDYFCQFKAILRIGDNDDDVVQIGIGYDLGQLSGRGFVPDATLLEDLAQNHGLY